MNPSRGAAEAAGRWRFLRYSQRTRTGRHAQRDCTGSTEAKIWGDWIWHREAHATQGTHHPGALPALLWHLSVVLYILNSNRHLFHSSCVYAFPRRSLWGFIQHTMYYFPHSNSFWCI